MAPEFRARGVAREQRGRITDDTLAFVTRCFAADEAEANGQPFLFRPRPARPPILVGGAPPHAFRRAGRFGDGWMPIGGSADGLRAPIAELAEKARNSDAMPTAWPARISAAISMRAIWRSPEGIGWLGDFSGA